MNKNKRTKKVLAGILGVAVLAAVPVCAENNAQENDHIDVTYAQSTSYTLSIPESITLSSKESAQSQAIGLSMVNTMPEEKVQVKIKSGITNNQVVLTRENDEVTKVVSDVTDYQNRTVSIGSVVAEFQDMSTTPIAGADTNILNFSAIKDSADSSATVKAGNYKGTIVFVASVVNRE